MLSTCFSLPTEVTGIKTLPTGVSFSVIYFIPEGKYLFKSFNSSALLNVPIFSCLSIPDVKYCSTFLVFVKYKSLGNSKVLPS